MGSSLFDPNGTLPASEGWRRDAELIRSYLRGSPMASDELSERLDCAHRFLIAMNARRGHPFGEEEVMDILGDVHLSVIRKLEEYRGEALLETWVHRFCVNHFLKAVETRMRARDQLLAYGCDGVHDEGEAVGGDEPLFDAGETLKHLSRREREVVRLHYWGRLKLGEIACQLGVDVSTVKTHHRRALDKLRTILVDHGGGAAG